MEITVALVRVHVQPPPGEDRLDLISPPLGVTRKDLL
ncbi:hypothetical protein ACVW1A_000275 [Bradyrhizobium sp. LB1.3]